MTTELASGKVPPAYRELFEILSSFHSRGLDRSTFVHVFKISGLSSEKLEEVFKLVGFQSSETTLSRTHIYKSLTFIALLQQGKKIHEKSIESLGDDDLPVPQFGDNNNNNNNGASDNFRRHLTQLQSKGDPRELGYSFKDLYHFDHVELLTIPEKKGIILKHIEYQVTSKAHQSTVLRRYNDFLTFHEMLLLRFPYRLIPKLPPKKTNPDRAFLEERRLGLERFLILVTRHPIVHSDSLVKYFFTSHRGEIHEKMKPEFKNYPDEFMVNEIAPIAKDLVSNDYQFHIDSSRNHLSFLHQCLTRMKHVIERTIKNANYYAADMLEMGKQLSLLGAEGRDVTPWAQGSNNTWPYLQGVSKHLSVEFGPIAETSLSHANQERKIVLQLLNITLDLLNAYRELLHRYEKGVIHDHERALKKISQMKSRKMSSTLRGNTSAGTVASLENQILSQEAALANMETRHQFFLYCLQMETQLVHANLDTIFCVIDNFVHSESRLHTNLGNLWTSLRPILDAIAPNIKAINTEQSYRHRTDSKDTYEGGNDNNVPARRRKNRHLGKRGDDSDGIHHGAKKGGDKKIATSPTSLLILPTSSSSPSPDDDRNNNNTILKRQSLSPQQHDNRRSNIIINDDDDNRCNLSGGSSNNMRSATIPHYRQQSVPSTTSRGIRM